VSANQKTIDTRWQDLGTALRRLLWRLMAIACLCGLLWIVWESARALSIF
jgi:hypothetical protein